MTFVNSFHKIAQMAVSPGTGGALAGLTSGYYSGRSAAGSAAHHLSREGYRTKNEETAKNVAKLTGAAGALGGLALTYKHKHKLMNALRRRLGAHPDMETVYEAALPFAGGTAGGMLGGAATGAATSLRGRLWGKRKHDSTKKEDK